MKKGIRAILCAVLCLPMIFGIIFALTSRPSQNQEKSFSKITITTDDGSIYEFSDKDTLKYYKDVFDSATAVSGVAASEDAKEFSVAFTDEDGKSKNYTFVMSAENHTNCVYKTLNNECFLLSSEDAYSLLLRNEFASAYSLGNVPLLTLQGGYYGPFEPADYSWKYKRVDEEFAQIDKLGDENNYTAALLRNQLFDVGFAEDAPKPDYVQVTIMQNGMKIYEGGPEGLSTAIALSSDTLLDAVLEAKWYESETTRGFGEAKYNFKLLYDVPATFSLVDRRLKQGEFTIIRVTNGNDESIKASSDFMAKEMNAFTYNGNKYIYVPIKSDATLGAHTINISDTAGPNTLNFTVTDGKFKTTDVNYRANVIALNTTKAKEEYSALLSNLSTKGTKEQLWVDKFNYPVNDGETVCAHGTKMNIIGVETKLSEGLYIEGAEGANVTAANNGVVLFAGSTDYTGNAVIVDHGVGVYSYYFNLGSVSCAEGDTVTSESVIGTVGTSGVTPYTNTIFYGNSVGGAFINPQTQIKYGIKF